MRSEPRMDRDGHGSADRRASASIRSSGLRRLHGSPRRTLSICAFAWFPLLFGCWSSARLAEHDGIRREIEPPALAPAPAANELPEPPPAQPVERPAPPTGPLELTEVLQSVDSQFPLLLAIAQEREIAAGQRLSAEGGFDLNLRSRGATQGGTFPNSRLDVFAEQPTPLAGLSFFTGYRLGIGDFPVYYGDRLTADGGEFRAGALLPLLRDRPIDRRRAALRQGRIAESLAEPAVQRARIEYLRAAARAYWSWVAAGEQCRVAQALLRIARDRQAGLEEQFRRGQIAEFVVIDNQRLIAERDGARIAADRRFQQTALDLSLFLRDACGDPIVPSADRLPPDFLRRETAAARSESLRADIETAWSQRPELVRFALLKERASIELTLAENQTLPALNAAIAGAQDVGPGKQQPGIFALERALIEGSLVLDVPLQRREAQGRVQSARAALAQIAAQERFARDQISTEVQDAVSNLERAIERLARAREELQVARRVADLERERFTRGQSTLLEVNLRELAAAGAEIKVVDTLADMFRAEADLRAALGADAATTPRPQ